jgi:hypothetical protein
MAFRLHGSGRRLRPARWRCHRCGVGRNGLGGRRAQQPAPAPKKAPAPPAAPKGAPAAKDAKGAAPASAWVKLCEKGTAVTKQKDGKEDKKEIDICMTHHERLDGNTGMVLVSAAVRQVTGQDKQALMVMVPLGMLLQPGMRAIYPKDPGKVQKNWKGRREQDQAFSSRAVSSASCTAETEMLGSSTT